MRMRAALEPQETAHFSAKLMEEGSAVNTSAVPRQQEMVPTLSASRMVVENVVRWKDVQNQHRVAHPCAQHMVEAGAVSI